MQKKAIAAPATSFQFLEPNQAKPQITAIIINQGDLINIFSQIFITVDG